MDVILCETGNGADFIFESKGFKLTEGISNQVYIGLFGGNIGGEERDREDSPDTEQNFDWFGNDLFFDPEIDFKFNSELETLLMQIALNSAGRIRIEETAEGDLDFMSEFGSVEVTAEIIEIDKLKIFVKIQQPENQENQVFSFIWDAVKLESSCLCENYIKRTIFAQGDNYSVSEYSSQEYEN